MKKSKIMIISLIALIVAIILICSIVIITKQNKRENVTLVNNEFTENQNTIEPQKQEEAKEEQKQEPKQETSKISIVDLSSNSRPYAVVVNNTPVAVKVQTGLNKAYLVYEIPTEGNTSRLMALYKDAEDITIGTIRSSRHNFIDYALESNAIYVHYGWSHYAEDQEKSGVIDKINGLTDSPFWRSNPENLASEHTAYTSIGKIKEFANKKGYKTTADDTILLKYSENEVNLGEKQNVQNATSIRIPYDNRTNTTTFNFDEESKMYIRSENGKECIDHKTKEKVSTKNIIVQKVDYEMCDDNYYWNIHTVGSGKGYFITNGNAVPIKWSKSSREAKTKYMYEDGQEIEVNDGRTYIELQTNKQQLTIK